MASTAVVTKVKVTIRLPNLTYVPERIEIKQRDPRQKERRPAAAIHVKDTTNLISELYRQGFIISSVVTCTADEALKKIRMHFVFQIRPGRPNRDAEKLFRELTQRTHEMRVYTNPVFPEYIGLYLKPVLLTVATEQ